MEPSSPSDPSTLTFRKYLSQQSSASPSIPSYQELAALRQELLNLSENASQRYEKYASELTRLDGGATLPQSKDSSLSSTPTSLASANTTSQGLNYGSSTGANASLAGRTSASPNTSSPSSFSSNSRAGGSSGTLTQGTTTGASPALVKLKLKRSDAAGMWFVCDFSHFLSLI